MKPKLHLHEYLNESKKILSVVENIMLNEISSPFLMVTKERKRKKRRPAKKHWWDFWNIGVYEEYFENTEYSVEEFQLKNINIAGIFNSCFELEKSLSSSMLPFPGFFSSTCFLEEYKNSRDEFIKAYDKYLKAVSTENQTELIECSKKLASIIRAIKFSLRLNVNALEAFINQEEPDQKRFTLYLPKGESFSDYLNRLNAFKTLYSECCMLLDVSEAEYPVKPLSIEYGSSFIDIIGNEKVIGLLIGVISGFGAYLYKKYTTDGKASLIPMSTEQIDKLIGLTERLEAAGIDVTEHKEIISKSALKIVKSADTILANQYVIELNGEKRILKNETNMLENKNDD